MESHSLARFTILSSSSRPVFSSVSIVVVTFSADRSLRPVSRSRVSALFFPDIYANSYSRGCNLKKWSLDGKLFHLLDITRGTILWIYFLAFCSYANSMHFCAPLNWKYRQILNGHWGLGIRKIRRFKFERCFFPGIC